MLPVRDFNLATVVFGAARCFYSTMRPNPLPTLAAQLHSCLSEHPSRYCTTHFLVYLFLLTPAVKSHRALRCRQKAVMYGSHSYLRALPSPPVPAPMSAARDVNNLRLSDLDIQQIAKFVRSSSDMFRALDEKVADWDKNIKLSACPTG